MHRHHHAVHRLAPRAPAAAEQARAVVLTSQAWGQDGGNNITAQIVNDGRDKALSVTLSGNAITVHAATDAAGVITSTAAQVVDAINATKGVAALVTATKYRTNAGAGSCRAARRRRRSATG